MVCGSPVIGLVTGKFLESTFCGLRSYGLQSVTSPLNPNSLCFDCFALVGVAFRINSDLSDTEIDTEDLIQELEYRGEGYMGMDEEFLCINRDKS